MPFRYRIPSSADLGADFGRVVAFVCNHIRDDDILVLDGGPEDTDYAFGELVACGKGPALCDAPGSSFYPPGAP